MNITVKNLWIAALRSGKYAQGEAYLNRNNKFCCLGVLCEVAIENNVKIEVTEFVNTKRYNGSPSHLTSSLREWAGLSAENCDTLMEMNDTHRYSFDVIANFIEGKL